jgi:hypothetical protein
MQSVAARGSLALAALLLAGSARAETLEAEPNQVTLEAGVLSGAVSYARRVAPHTLVGAGAGVGLELLSYVRAGDHFTDDLSNDKSFDLYEGRLFVRQELSQHVSLEVGLRAARVLHVFDGDADAGVHHFVGGYVTPMFGWRLFQLGPTVSAGVFGRDSDTARSATSELGVRVTALTGRFTFRF